MSLISKKLRDVKDNGLTFWCPGCKERHTIYHGNGSGARWMWNGDIEKPTFSPSVLVKSGHYASHYDGNGCWCTYNAEDVASGEQRSGFECHICHSFIRDGRIQFLGDCTHDLAGQIVDLPDLPEACQ